MRPLDGPAREELHKAVLSAFDHDALRQLVAFRLKLNLDHIVGNGPFVTVVFKFIEHCEQHGITEQLVDAVIAERPQRDDLRDLKTRLTSTPSVVPTPAVTRSRFQLPHPLLDFTGRVDALHQITERLRGAGKSVGISSALRGMGGVGKTVTAVKAAWEVKDDFPDGQLVVELRGTSEQPMTAVQAMSQLIRDFQTQASKLPDDEKDLQMVYRQVLEGKKALVLLDDARDESQVRPLLGVPSVAFVITSRNALELDAVESIRLGVLPADEAFVLLRGIVGEKGTDAELQTVSELCGRLPLALRVAGDFLRLHENCSLPKYIAALQDEAKRLERLKGKSPDRDVEAVLGLSASALVSERAQLAERWQLLSVFPADFDVLAAAAVWDLKTGDEVDVSTTDDELTALLERSLVQFDTATERYSLHDLMRPIAREAFAFVDGHASQTDSPERLATAQERFASFYCRVLAEANELYLKGNDNVLRGLALFDREETNIRHGHAWAVQQRTAKRTAAELCRDYPNAGVYTIQLRLFAREQITWLEESHAACRELGDRRGEGMSLGNLGLAWAALGDARKAIGFYDQVLTVAREIGDRRGEGASLGNLGLAWMALGNAHKAIGFHEQALVVFREFGDRREEGSSLGNLGLAWMVLGDARKAIGFYERVLFIARAIGDRRGEGSTLGDLGNAWMVLGDARKAIEFHEQALVVSRKLGHRHGEGMSLGNLGLAWVALGDARKAIGFYEQHLTVARKIGDRHGEAGASFNMARALHSLEQPDEAIRLAENALIIFNEIESPHAEAVRRKLAEWRGEATT